MYVQLYLYDIDSPVYSEIIEIKTLRRTRKTKKLIYIVILL